MTDPISQFREEMRTQRKAMAESPRLRELSLEWIVETAAYKYSYGFEWMGRPVIQFPQDLLAMQEIIWRVKPDLIIECGVAHGGALVFYASMLELLGGEGRVVGIEVELRPHNRAAIDAHPMRKRIDLIDGSSIDEAVAARVRQLASAQKTVLVALDSNHSSTHVLHELELYAPLVTPGSYVVVFDTVVEDMPGELFNDRPWGPGDSPKTAVHEFLRRNADFEIDRDLEAKLLISVAPDGYLRRIQ